MKALVLFLAIVSCVSRVEATHLFAGDTFTFEFTSLLEVGPRIPPGGCTEGAEIMLRFSGDFLESNELVRLEFFENSLLEPPFYSRERSGLRVGTGAFGGFLLDHWQDLQGIIRITVIAGSINVNQFDVRVQDDCGLFTNIFRFPSPPTVTCAGAIVLDCTNAKSATLTASVEDLGGNAMAAAWFVDGVLQQTNHIPDDGIAGNLVTRADINFVSSFAPGRHVVDVVVSNHVAATICSTVVTVQDTTPPVVYSARANPGSLWPPNRKFSPVNIEVTAKDACSSVTCSITSVISNDPSLRPDDWDITGPLTVKLRAVRGSGKKSRIYTVILECVDDFGNKSVTSVQIPVTRKLSSVGKVLRL